MAAILDMPEDQAASFESWPALLRWLAPRLAQQQEKSILIIDELSYVSAADPAVVSALQHAWDHHLKDSNLVIVLCGSQITTMEAIMQHQSPLFGRFTGRWFLQPLPFYSLDQFFPNWSIEEQLRYMGLWGVPAYLEWLDDRVSRQNIQNVMLRAACFWLNQIGYSMMNSVISRPTKRYCVRLAEAHIRSKRSAMLA